MGAWLRCAIPTLPTDILDQHSSVLHILASEEFVAVADLTVSGCRGAINSYSRKRSRIRSKLEHRGVLDKRDIYKLDLALDSAAQGHHSLSDFAFHSGFLPVTLAKGAMVELLKLSAPPGQERDLDAIIKWLSHQPRPNAVSLSEPMFGDKCRKRFWFNNVWAGFEDHRRHYAASASGIATVMPFLNSQCAMYEFTAKTAHTPRALLAQPVCKIHNAALRLARSQRDATRKSRVTLQP